MKTFIFNITFICANTGEYKSIDKEYRAKSFNLALQGIEDYAKTNKTFKRVISISDRNSRRLKDC